MNRSGKFLAVSLTLSTMLCAQSSSAQEAVSPTAKGLIGGGLLGAEAVMITESIIGVKPWWAYAVGGGVGAGGGAALGYLAENSSSDGVLPTYLLAGGLALVIPTLVLTLNATRYRPVESATEDAAPTNEPKADPGAQGGSSIVPPTGPVVPPPPAPLQGTPATPKPETEPAKPATPPPTTLLDIRKGTFSVGVPIPQMRQMFTTAEMNRYGMQQRTEVRLPIVSGSF